MKLHSFVLLVVLGLLSAGCGPAFDSEATLAKKSALVIMSGPYRQQRTEESSALAKVFGKGDTQDKLLIVRTGAVFEKEGDSHESFSLVNDITGYGSSRSQDTERLSQLYSFEIQRIIPGRYHLTKYYFGKYGTNYDAEACGKIMIDVKEGEAVYIGGIQPSIDSKEALRIPFAPKFEIEKVPTAETLEENYFTSRYPDWIRSLKWVTRLPVADIKDPPKGCVTKNNPFIKFFSTK